MRRFAAPSLPGPGQELLLDPAVSHHLLRVSGIAPGEPVLLFDGAGLEAEAVLLGAEAGQARMRQVSDTRRRAVAQRRLLVALSKHAAMDTIMRMATELGASHIQPFVAERSVARGDRADRWGRITTGAAAQSGRATLPELGPTGALAEVLAALPDGLERRVYVPGSATLAPPQPPCCLLLGPEGGLTDAEVQLALDHGFSAEGLGDTVLRADTAVAAALARAR